MTQEASYTIGQLAQAAGITPRTIRYYTAEGLLPEPQAEGKYARYTEGHLQRIRLIQRLKYAHLPLATIRAQIEGLSDEELQELLARCSASMPEEEAAGRQSEREEASVQVDVAGPHALQSHLDYIAQILAVTGQAVMRPDAASPSRKPRALLVSPALRPQEIQEPEAPGRSGSDAPSTVREVWERVRLAPDAELHVRLDGTRKERARMERLIAATRALFHARDGEAHDA